MSETKTVEIKHRGRDEVLYTAQIPTEPPRGMAMRVALERARKGRGMSTESEEYGPTEQEERQSEWERDQAEDATWIARNL